MRKIIINGGAPLEGKIDINGMKNAAMPIIFGCLLVDGDCYIDNLPDINDVKVCLQIIEGMGAEVERISKNAVRINAKNVNGGSSEYALVSKIRASYYLMGAELGRFGKMSVGCPGGCNFGKRPIDQHVKGFQALGVEISESDDYLNGIAWKGLRGANIFFDVVSVGATINVMLAAVKAEGTTVIDNAAKEPHIVDLANFLNTCGADIRGAGTNTIKINGVDSLEGCSYTIIPDMIEAGTYMVAAAATHGYLTINNVIPRHLESVSVKLVEMGVIVEELDDSVIVDARNADLRHVNIKTMPYPGFPTDMQPQFGVLMAIANGQSAMYESIYEEKRFKYIDELVRMGANVSVSGKIATFTGVAGLRGAKVRSVDLRAGAAVVIAGLCAEGRTEIDDVHLIERGYDSIVEKLTAVGADIRYVEFPEYQ